MLSNKTDSPFGHRPEAGVVPFPIMTLDENVFAGNIKAMLRYTEAVGAEIAPHAKTAMSPELSQKILDRGAWGLSVANQHQAAVFLRKGVRRLLVANQIGGLASAQHFADLLCSHQDAEVYFFVDSEASLSSVARVGSLIERSLPVLIEVGTGRAGARDVAAVKRIVDVALQTKSCFIAGIAAYEGASATSEAESTVRAIADLNSLVREAFYLVRSKEPDRRLIVTAGGSSFFDLEVASLKPLVTQDGNARLILRSGAIFFHDHGTYQRSLAQLDKRNGFASVTGASASSAFRPAIKVWAEILSRPEPKLAICGMGKRDVSFDKDLPTPLTAYRSGTQIAGDLGVVAKLNDHHAFLELSPESPLEVGDVVSFGISHPCTCLDRRRLFYGLGADGTITAAYPTYFD